MRNRHAPKTVPYGIQLREFGAFLEPDAQPFEHTVNIRDRIARCIQRRNAARDTHDVNNQTVDLRIPTSDPVVKRPHGNVRTGGKIEKVVNVIGERPVELD